MQVLTKSFQELSVTELYALLKLRTDVFVVEQNCPYPELDNKDQKAFHILGYKQSNLVAYARIFEPFIYFDGHAAIGRIVTDPETRNQNFGKEIVHQAIVNCRKLYGNDVPIKIAAQAYLQPFYRAFGFKAIGKEFLEDDIPHVHMIL